ncbi:c-type cytochrome [Bordetella sp. 2513F-2]
MSNEQAQHEEHASPIKTPKQLIVTIVLAFLIPIVVILLLVHVVSTATKPAAGSDAFSAEAVSKRIAPVAGFELVDANAPKVFKTGEQVFQQVCTSCHAAGVAGAPKVGDKAAWAPFIKAGFESMMQVALHGKGAMPAKGGNPALSDYEVARAVVYMANQSGGDLPEPAAPEEQGGQAQVAAAPAATPAAPAAAPAPAPAPAQQAQQQPQPQQQQQPRAAAPQQQAAVNPAGEKLYKSTCFACHGTGVANAPKFGDKAAWAPYIATGMDAMVQVAMQGKGAMPPKGGAATASEADIRAAVEYMVNAAK